MLILIFFFLTVLCFQLPFTFAQEASTKAANPDPLVTGESDYILKDFHFVDEESLPELKLHYRTIGQPARNSSTGEVKNAVLLIHGTTGTGKEFLAKDFRDAMFEPGQPLDAAKYYLILPDAIEASADYDPAPDLQKIQASVLAINFADDELNPPELGIVDRAKERLRNGQFVLIPASSQTRGHMTLREASIYAPLVADFLTQLPMAN